MKTYEQPDAREIEQFWSKKWQPREHSEKTEWIRNMVNELGLKKYRKRKYTSIHCEWH